MKRVRERERDRDQITAAVKEINNLKKELREIKELLKNGCKKN
jgi:DNA anti-recombination protein RmuC